MSTPEPSPDQVILPQRASRQRVSVGSPSWSFEPFWRGHRLMARLADGRVSLTDDSGLPMDAAFPEVADVLLAAVDADEAVLDGVWTVQPFLGRGSAAERWSEAIATEAGDLP